MQDILYIKAEQNIPTTKKALTLQDVVTLYSFNKQMVKELNQEPFYTLPKEEPKKTAFTILKVYEVIHRRYPNVTIENLGELDFIVEYQNKKQENKWLTIGKVILIAFAIFIGAGFTIMTFNEDVSVASLFDNIYYLFMGTKKQGASVLEVAYSIGIPIGILTFYNHFKKRKVENDPTPVQVEMRTYEEQMNKALIKTSSREGKTIDIN